MITRRQLLQFSAATAAAAGVKQATRAEAQTADAPLFPGFKTAKIKTSGSSPRPCRKRSLATALSSSCAAASPD